MLEMCIPDTSLTNCRDLREKTVRAGTIARAASVFKVDRIVVYQTGPTQSKRSRDSDLLTLILEYANTPQYLRKRLYPVTDVLRYAGLIPPLRTRGHPLASEALSNGDLRWGLPAGRGSVDIGLADPVPYDRPVSDQRPTLFRVVSTAPETRLSEVDYSEQDVYLGYEVETEHDLIGRLQETSAVRIALSRRGRPFRESEAYLREVVSRGIVMVFGGPDKGVGEIFERKFDELRSVLDIWINTVEGQGTETVRLEEAITISLALFNSSFGRQVTRRGFYEHPVT